MKFHADSRVRLTWWAMIASALAGAAAAILLEDAVDKGTAGWRPLRRAHETVICLQSPTSSEELFIKSRFLGKGNGRQVVAVSNSREHHADPDTLSEYVFYDENSPVIFQCLGDTLILYVGVPAPEPTNLRTGFTIVQRHDGDLLVRSAIDRAFDRRLRAVREGASCYE